MPRIETTAGALVLLSVIVIASQSSRPLNAQSDNSATYTAAQAAAGRTAYSQNCATCHGPNTDDGEFAPPLKGATFMQEHSGKPVGELINYMSGKMPPGSPGTLGASGYTQIAAFILQQNGVPPGPAELPSDASQLSSLIFPGGGPQDGRSGRGRGAGPSGGLTPGVKLPAAPVKTNPLDRITPVSDAMLQNPPAGDWLTWRRGFDYQGFQSAEADH